MQRKIQRFFCFTADLTARGKSAGVAVNLSGRHPNAQKSGNAVHQGKLLQPRSNHMQARAYPPQNISPRLCSPHAKAFGFRVGRPKNPPTLSNKVSYALCMHASKCCTLILADVYCVHCSLPPCFVLELDLRAPGMSLPSCTPSLQHG